MKKYLFTLSLLVTTLGTANLYAAGGYLPDPNYAENYCELPRTQSALTVIQTCKDREDWAACVTGQEDLAAKTAYVKVCADREKYSDDAIINLASLKPCDCLARIQKTDPTCGANISCEAPVPTETPEPASPPPSNQNQNQGQGPGATAPSPTMSGSGCSLGGMVGSFDGFAWIAGLGFLAPALFRRRS